MLGTHNVDELIGRGRITMRVDNGMAPSHDDSIGLSTGVKNNSGEGVDDTAFNLQCPEPTCRHP